MLHIILLILKFIGFLVLIVIGLLLLGGLLVLLVPIRYQFAGSYYWKVKGKARFSWLLHILSVTVLYEEDVSVAVRLFGFRIRKTKKMDEESKKAKEAEEILVQTMEVREPQARSEDWREKKGISPPQKETKKKERGKRISWFSKLKKKVLRVLSKLKFFFKRIYDTLNSIKEKKEEIQAWIVNKENKNTVKLIIKQGKKLIRHVFPVKGNGNITFGFEDPYLTGQVLTYASVFYPLCHKRLYLYPVFDRSVFTAEGTFRGRIRIGRILLIGIRLFFDRNFRVLLKKWLR